MSVTQDEVRKVARLARIAVPEDRLASLAGELSEILDWVDTLGEVDIAEVEPMTSAVETRLAMREDVVSDGDKPDDILANAPRSQDGFFVVPKSVD